MWVWSSGKLSGWQKEVLEHISCPPKSLTWWDPLRKNEKLAKVGGRGKPNKHYHFSYSYWKRNLERIFRKINQRCRSKLMEKVVMEAKGRVFQWKDQHWPKSKIKIFEPVEMDLKENKNHCKIPCYLQMDLAQTTDEFLLICENSLSLYIIFLICV